ncbi:FecR domain-containing protein [candidate division KSB1 bacterium]|nr:FecR domain-containing protein [candidate division KSB1 bacterium]
MKKQTVLWVALLSTAFTAVFLFGQTNTQKKGLVTFADGQVKRKASETMDWQNAPVNTEVLSGDQMRTYRQSRAELNLAEMDVVRLAPRTIIDIVKLYEETKDKQVETAIHLEQGELWASVHKVEADTKFDITAPISAAAITGTVLRLNVADDTTTQLKVYEGEVKIKSRPQKMSQTVPHSLVPHEVSGPTEVPGPHEVTVEQWFHIIKNMQQITIDKKGNVVSVGDFTENDVEEKSDWVQWNKSLDEIRLNNLKQRLNVK